MAPVERRWRVRQALLQDCPAISFVAAATFLETFNELLDGMAIINHSATALSAEALEAQMRLGDRFWIAQSLKTGAPLGYAQLGESELPNRKSGDVELRRIYILQHAQGCGLGRELFDKVMEAAIERSARRLTLGVYDHNEPAKAFYAKLGFEFVCERSYCVGGRAYPDTVLGLPLPPPPLRSA